VRNRDTNSRAEVLLSHSFCRVARSRSFDSLRSLRMTDGARGVLRVGLGAGLSLLAALLTVVALGIGPGVHAGEEARTAEDVAYASPLEVLLSPDGARLYVLCQGAKRCRVLDAASYAVIKRIAVGRVPRGFRFRLMVRGYS
jgi:YVTN family beta-propeller protein